MRTSRCICGNRLFFGNFTCLQCGRDVGSCSNCLNLTALTGDTGELHCASCGVTARLCRNRADSVCNAFVTRDADDVCSFCRYTSRIPDLSQSRSHDCWKKLELEKRRLLIQLRDLDLPPFAADTGQQFPLRFQFLTDELRADGTVFPVYTGHQEGIITINIKEADSVTREIARVWLKEPQRTVIGHFRHEIGHYIEWSYVSRTCMGEFRRVFGDSSATPYEPARDAYYQNGPRPDWADAHVSPYATMHPSEDFAETVNLYLDLVAIAQTAAEFGQVTSEFDATSNPEQVIAEALRISVMVSEFNHDMGLSALLPERISPEVATKLAFVHGLRQRQSTAQCQPTLSENSGGEHEGLDSSAEGLLHADNIQMAGGVQNKT